MTSAASTPWTGRLDGDGPEHSRWHQVVVQEDGGIGSVCPATPDDDAAPHIALLGFRTDEGVRRNRGRIGAADGPAALRRALAPMAVHGAVAEGRLAIHDFGDAVTEGEDLEGGQESAARLTRQALDRPGARLAVVLGGGHETAWSSYLGLSTSDRLRGASAAAGESGADSAAGDASRAVFEPRWGVLNLDAHFDLREEPRATSGTPFAQMAAAEAAAGRSLRYAVLGIAEPSNTGALFDAARDLGVSWWTDVECVEAGTEGIRQFVADFAADLDVLYLTIDLDVLPAAAAPGVSAPAAYGVPVPLIESAVRAAAATGKLALLDVVELNPVLDIDGRTARTAARLIDTAVRGVA